METTQVSVQPTVGGMVATPKNVFYVPNEELKDFYLKFAHFLNPGSCSANRTEFEILNILRKELKKNMDALNRLNMHVWHEGITEIQTLCGTYSIQDNLGKKERMQMNISMGKHLQFLIQSTMDSPVFKQMYKNYSLHYNRLEGLLKQMAKDMNLPKEES